MPDVHLEEEWKRHFAKRFHGTLSEDEATVLEWLRDERLWRSEKGANRIRLVIRHDRGDHDVMIGTGGWPELTKLSPGRETELVLTKGDFLEVISELRFPDLDEEEK